MTLRLPESEIAALIAEGMLARIKRARREHEHDAECADDYELEHDRDLADRIAPLAHLQ